MAFSYPAPISVIQIGSYFVGQYYHLLQQKPDLVHQFYSEVSTMVRSDGATSETAMGMLQIHNLIMSLNFMAVEIRTAQSLESWSGGVLVMVSGLMQTKDYSARRKFVQTFFLAPQEKGYFVLNDIFYFLEEEQLHQHPAAMLSHSTTMLAQSNFETNLNASNPMPEPVSDYVPREEIQTKDFAAPVNEEENETVHEYSIPEQQQQVTISDERIEETTAEEPAASFPSSTVNTVRDIPPASVEEPGGESSKQTYASILRIAKGQSGYSTPHPASLNKSTLVTSEWHHLPQPTLQHSHSNLPSGLEKSNLESMEEVVARDIEGEEKSVYLGNLPSSITVSDLEKEFENFGRIRLDGVTIRSRKEAGVFYAFVEFEDAISVQNALKASPVQINGRLVHVEGRRLNSGPSRGRRGRGRSGYQSEAPRVQFGGRSFRRGGSGLYNDYKSRPRGNGYSQRGPLSESGILGNQVSRNGHNLREALA